MKKIMTFLNQDSKEFTKGDIIGLSIGFTFLIGSVICGEINKHKLNKEIKEKAIKLQSNIDDLCKDLNEECLEEEHD